MISQTYANNILNTLVGVKGATQLSAPTSIYLGLCASEPAKEDGALTNAEEPTSVASYNRKSVGGTDNTTQSFGASASGAITNTLEIQMSTAREDYPKAIKYWFLTTTSTKGFGNAFLWGEIKDVLSAKQTVEGFASESTYNMYTASTICETLLDLKADAEYIVSWSDGETEKEYKVTSAAYTKGDVSYIGLGNPKVFGGTENKDIPFGILYNETTTGTDTTGTLTIYTDSKVASHDVAIYGIGITIKKATVPTFYENELKVSIN